MQESTKNVFLLGATGYIGKHITQQLIASGYEVYALIRNPEKANQLPPQVHTVLGDLREPQVWLDQLANKTAVIHAAFPSHGGTWAESVAHEGVFLEQLVEKLTNQETTLILSNGTAFLGDSGTQNRLDESAPILEAHPGSIRGKMIEKIRQAANQSLKIMELRLASFVYGEDGSVFLPILLESARKTKKSIFVEEGNFFTSTLHVEAAARAYVDALEQGKSGEIYHIAGDEEPSIRDIAQAVAVAVGKDCQTISVSAEEALHYLDPFTAMFLSQNNRLDSQKARKELAWSGHTPVPMLWDIAYGSYRVC